MINYIELAVELAPFSPYNEIAVVWLAEIGFESFIDEEPQLKAYIPESEFDVNAVTKALDKLNDQAVKVSFSYSKIPAQNWNKVWEDGFDPVIIDDLSIVAPFHEASYRKKRVIEIEPKMSFGTGHHQTTFLMCKAMQEMDLANKKVLDMGTGTGILAINAEQLGAAHILAVDVEPWSVENTIENCNRNQCNHITALLGDIDVVTEGEFNVILANINRNVLMSHMKAYSELLLPRGVLLLSGFFTTDIQDLEVHAANLGLKRKKWYEKENWASIWFEKD